MTEVERAAKRLGVSSWAFEAVTESFTSQVRFVSNAGARAVLKVFWNASKLEREHAALSLLRGLTHVPRVLATCDDPPAMLMTRLPGTPIRAVNTTLAWEIGACLARVQMAEVTATSGWWETLKIWVAEQIERCRGVCELDWDLIESTFARLLADRAPVEQRLVHFDFRLGNLLTDGSSLTGVVDFESARPGAVDFDFAKASLEIWPLGDGLERAMLDGYASVRPLPPQLHENLALYRLYAPLSAIGWCEKRRLRNAFFDQSVQQLRAALAELP